MPLIAMLEDQRIDATTYTSETWTELKQSEDGKRMLMPLCGIRAVPKARGTTLFFAHHRLADCKVDHGGESPQHLAVKTALRDRIDAVPGWHASLEYPHPSRELIIDVLAESHDRRRRIAFEVQLSSQTPEKYQARRQRRFNDQVFPVWIVPRRPEYNRVEVPVVVAGFGKSSQVPEHPAALMELDIVAHFAEQDTLGELVDHLLTRAPRWPEGSPDDQLATIRKSGGTRSEGASRS